MILRPRVYVSPEEKASLLPKVGDKVNVMGRGSVIFLVQAVGMRWYRVINEAGESLMAKREEVLKYVPPPPPPSETSFLPGVDSMEARDLEFNDERLDTPV